MIDTSIYGLAGRGVKSVADYDAEYSQARQNKLAEVLGQAKVDEYQRGIRDQNELRAAMSAPGADPYNTLLRAGRVKEATDFAKGKADVEKTGVETEAKKIETAHKRVDLMGQTLGWVRANPTIENATQAVQYLVSNGVMSQEKAQEALAKFSADPSPQGISAFADMGFRAALSAKDQLPKYDTRNLGGTTQMTAVDPVTGQVRVVNSAQNTQSPDNAASIAQQERNSQRVDARSRDSNDIQRSAARTQVVETPDGVMLVDKGTGQARQATAGGVPLAGKPSAAMEKELTGINQQRAIVRGALEAVKANPDAFSMSRGLATMAGPIPESIAGRFDTDAQRQSRSYLFNNVSKVINERAGAAQSSQELARLRSFLPAETDAAPQIISKMEAFDKYLDDMEAGTRGKPVPKAGGATGGWSIQKVN